MSQQYEVVRTFAKFFKICHWNISVYIVYGQKLLYIMSVHNNIMEMIFMNKNTRYEIRLSVQLKNEFMSIGGDANIVRTLMEDYIIKTNNEIVRTQENPNALWNLSCRYNDNVCTPKQLVRTKDYIALMSVQVINKGTGEIVRTYDKGQPVKKKFVRTDNYILKEI